MKISDATIALLFIAMDLLMTDSKEIKFFHDTKKFWEEFMVYQNTDRSHQREKTRKVDERYKKGAFKGRSENKEKIREKRIKESIR